MKRFAIAAALLWSSASFAQINVSLAPGASPGAPAVATGLQPVTNVSSDTAITVTCTNGVDCNFASVKVGDKTIPLSVANPRSGSIPLSFVSSSGTALHVFSGSDGKEVSGSPVQLLRTANSGTTSTSTTGTTTNTNTGTGDQLVVVQTPCDRVRFNPSYSQTGNRAHFVVTTGGSIVQYPDEPVDENDVIVFHVVGPDQGALQNIEVSRVSPTRTTGNLNILGSGTTFQQQSATNTCYERQFELGDFAPGEGKVEIATVSGTQRTVTGTVTFNVNRLWDGILSLGPGWSNVVDEAYGLAPNASGQNVIVKTNDGKSDVVYIVQYTQYMWGRRDVEKTYPLYQHFNPSIGFSMTSFKNHAFAGLSFDWKQFIFTAGVHAAKVTRLASGTSVGQTFSGAANTIPTETKWQTGPYVAVTVDVRAVKALLSVTGQ